MTPSVDVFIYAVPKILNKPQGPQAQRPRGPGVPKRDNGYLCRGSTRGGGEHRGSTGEAAGSALFWSVLGRGMGRRGEPRLLPLQMLRYNG